MGQTRDHRGRPVVAVTGYGMISSLGQGVEDTWAGLTAGHSGIKRISRFPTDNMRTTIAGAIDYLWQDGDTAMDITMRAGILAGEEAIADADIGSKGDFPGPLFAAMPPAEMEWPYRRRDLQRTRRSTDGDAYDRMIARGAQGQRRRRLSPHAARLHRRRHRREDRHEGRADLADHRLRLRRHRHPARRRGDPPRRHRRRHLDRRRLLGQPGNDDPLRPAVGAVRHQRSARGSVAAVLEGSRRFRHRGGRGGAGAGGLRRGRWRAAPRIHAIMRGIGEKADDFHRTRSKPDGSAIIGAIRTTIDDAGIVAGRDRLHQRARHLDAGKRQDGGDVAGGGVRRAHEATCRSARTSR